MDRNYQNRNNDMQKTRKFDSVSDRSMPQSDSEDGIYIYERPAFSKRSNQQKTNPASARKPVSAKKKSKEKSKTKKSSSVKSRKKPKRVLTEKEKQVRRRRLGLRFAFFSIVVSISVMISVVLISCMNDILAMNRSKEPISVSVNQDMSTDQVIDALADKGLIKNRGFCKLASKILGLDDTEFLTSVYFLPPSYGLEKMIYTMSTDAIGSETVRLIFPEGYTIEQIFAKLEEYEVCSAVSLRATAMQMDFSEDFPFLKSIPNPTERFYYLEGYLYPDTYEFYVGENATSVISRFLTNFQKHWTEEYANRAAELNMSMDDVINMASIIEKEAYGSEQMALVSSVLHNRLSDTSAGLELLQCNSTTNYIPAIPEDVLAGNERNNFMRLYDTYQSPGLPAGPICSPGDAAIYAALYPEDTNYYYFRHDVNGEIYMARTKAEHDRNGEKVLRVNAAAGSSEE